MAAAGARERTTRRQARAGVINLFTILLLEDRRW
jgi:hypothetical protein